MTRNLFGVFASVVVAGTLVAAQDSSSPASPNPAPQAPAAQSAQAPAAQENANDPAFTGCLVQGSGPNAYFLDNAKAETAGKDEKGQRFALEINATPDQIKPVLNSHVRIVATADPTASASESAAAPASASKSDGDEKKSGDTDVQKITVKRITRLAATCPATK